MRCDCVLFFLSSIFLKNECHAIYLTNGSQVRKNKPAMWTEEGIWGPMLEKWALEDRNYRESRVKQIPISEHAYIVQDLIDSEILKEIYVGKIIARSPNNSYKPPINNKPAPRQVSETDLYLLSAIEKLVYKVDIMEKRLRKVEEMLYFVMIGNRMDNEPCMQNFTRVGQYCYMFASMTDREYDWKVARKHCKELGAVLAEMETIEENQNIIAYIQSNVHLKGKDFWIGGLNPGLLWIWSDSARPVIPSSSQNNKDNPAATIQGEGRCLKLTYNPASRYYAYKGANCSVRYSYICQSPENTSSNEIQRIGRNRKIFDEL